MLREYLFEIAVLGLAVSALVIGCWRRPEVEQHRAPQASGDVSPVDGDGDILAVLVRAIVLFGPRLHTLTSLLHGRFAQSDGAGSWQSDVVLAAYVSGLVAGAEPKTFTPLDLLTRCVGLGRAEAAFARCVSGAAPWASPDANGALLPSGLLGAAELAGRLDGTRIGKRVARVCASRDLVLPSVGFLDEQRLGRLGVKSLVGFDLERRRVISSEGSQ